MAGTLESSIAALLERILACFRRERVPYVLIGAWALAVWGRPRATTDVDFLVQIFQRKRRRRLDGHSYWLVSPEDFILQKLKVARPRDFEDALSVLERSGKTLDRQYLRRWAGRIGVSGELHYIRSL